MNQASELDHGGQIAIVGMAARFPGAKTPAEFWENLRSGVESVAFFSDKELVDSGVPKALLNAPNYVKARAILEGVELFDAAFFGFNPREAEIMDPQHRLFLECAWEALEAAGYDPESYPGSIGVYAGSNFSSYLLSLFTNERIMRAVGQFRAILANDKDYLSTLTSYKLNLKGPSISVQTACSTSLVAVHLACQSLLNGECDLALAGGVSVNVPQKTGYLYVEGGIASPDGHCRAFDQAAQGAISGNGLGLVVLKRLTEALKDGDLIEAVIRASAVNNDGAARAGYTAPSLDGQTQVITEALGVAGIPAESITYLEAHGTGTPLGDPIEITALTKAFRSQTSRTRFCAIGSVKTNIGHLDAAAGVAGLIKTVLALKNKQIPASLHFNQPNPRIDFANSPFYVNTELTDWQPEGHARRAGLSSFGIGGTNAHLIIEEAPERMESDPPRPYQLLVLSAKTGTALESSTRNLVEHLRSNTEQNIADTAYTLQVGRKAFGYRRILTCANQEDAASTLAAADRTRVFSGYYDGGYAGVGFMFPGQGSQHVNMGLGLYKSERTFRERVDDCAEILSPLLGLDIRTVIYPPQDRVDAAAEQLNRTCITQPALFVVEFALASLLIEWGVRPEGMIGHSIGEYVAACIAEVFPLEDALKLTAARGRLTQKLTRGRMLAIGLSQPEMKPLLRSDISLAAVNAPRLCVASGSETAIDELEEQLTAEGVFCRRLPTSHAFHSHLMEPMLAEFATEVEKVRLRAPRIAYISNVTGHWIKDEESRRVDYWVRHLRNTVLFSDGLKVLMKSGVRVLMEVGPGHSLKRIALQQDDRSEDLNALSCLDSAGNHGREIQQLLNVIGNAWIAGVEVDWAAFHVRERRNRVALPTYPFERERHWLASPRFGLASNWTEPGSELRNTVSTHENGRQNVGNGGMNRAQDIRAPVTNPGLDVRAAGNSIANQTCVSSHPLERVMAQQLDVMARQLDLLLEADSGLSVNDEANEPQNRIRSDA